MKTGRRIFTPIVVALTAAAVVMVATVLVAAATMNAQTAANQTVLLNNGLTDRVQEINHMVVTQVVWDDAVQHLDAPFDAQWAHANIGAFLSTTDGFDGATVLNGANQAVYAMRGGVDVDPVFAAPDAATNPLVDWVRRAEARRTAPQPGDWARLMKSPIQASAFAKVGGKLELITVTLVQPDFGHVTPQTGPAPVVVTLKFLDDPFVAGLGSRFLLKDLRILPPGASGGVPLSGAGGEALGRLAWTADRPGDDVLRKGAPLIALFMVLMAVVAYFLFRQARGATDELVASEQRAQHMALHDPLTGLPNRRLFADRLQQALQLARRASRSTAVLQIEFAHPEGGGRAFGDERIEQIAQRLSETCRSADTLARLGGDTFAVIQPDGSATSANALAERILAAFKAPIRLTAGPTIIPCFIGAAVAAEPETDGESLIRQAEVALGRAHELGASHSCFFEPEMDAALRLRRELESDLRQALIEGALSVHYQPQFDETGSVIGLEALARWDHPLRGLISPAIFVQIAEESRLIGALGLFTLRRALEDGVRWPQLKVAVNLSAGQIALPGLADDVRALLAKFERPASRFELEINESLLLEANEHAQSVVRGLKALGLSVALDNFGAGQTSLSRLSRYPIDKIKIDRSFINRLGVDPEAGAVVGAVVKLAKAFGLEVMAEGVETDEQRRRLVELGCGRAQGFLFSKPLPPEQVETFLKAAAAARA